LIKGLLYINYYLYLTMIYILLKNEGNAR